MLRCGSKNRLRFFDLGLYGVAISIFFLVFFSSSVYGVDYSVSMTVSNSVAVNVAPELSGNDSVGISSGSITASTTCPAGYNIQIATTVSDPKLYLNGNTANASTAINPVSGTSLSSGTYGYSLTSTTASGNDFHALSYDGTLLKNTSTSGSSTFNVYFGVKVSKSLALGTYQMTDNGSITYYMTMDPTCLPKTLEEAFEDAGKVKEIANDGNAYYRMQDMNGDICDAANVLDENSALQLVDSRDGKLYWVTKLQDNHCWMTQNLDLDINANTTYTHNDTDLGWGSDTTTMTWKPDKSTGTWNGSSFTNWSNSSTAQYSADPGDYYYTDTFRTSSDVNYLTTTNTDYFNTIPYSNNGTHGHVGNYYNWTAAIASNDSSSYTSSTLSNIANNPQNSICPAGWRLPTVIDSNTNPKYTSDGSKNEPKRVNYLYNSDSSNTSIGLEASPLFFSRAGYVRENGGTLSLAGNYGYYLSSTVAGSSSLWAYYFYPTFVGTTNAISRSGGHSVRCVARDTEDTRTQSQIDEEFAKAGNAKVVANDGTRHYRIQEMRNSVCNAVTDTDNDTQTQLIDSRDGNVYWVAKLRDGHCWMTQNLDLDLDSTKTYTYLDTDLGWGSDKTTLTWQPARSTINASGGSFSGWSNNVSSPYSADLGDWYYAGYSGTGSVLSSTTVNYLTTTNTNYFNSTPYAINGSHGHVGNYYNYTASIASNNSSSYSTSTFNNISANPQNSICPAGWRLPTISSASDNVAGSTNEFARLNRLYNNSSTNNSAGLEALPLAFTRNGDIYSSALENSGNTGNYWASTVGQANFSYTLYFQSSRVTTNSYNYGNRRFGLPIRCVARAESGPESLYDKIAKLSKGTQTASELKAVLTVPTSSDPTIDTSNSGVYEYNAATFGVASDASNSYPIYYYRGILDSNLDTADSTKYGSNGNGAYYPNYVKLGDTCWRIVRTTGSGGVKLIYNGLYGTTSANSCANSQTNAATFYSNSSLTMPFNTTSSSKTNKTYTGLEYHNIHSIGYTYSNVAAGTTSSTAYSVAFGAFGNDTTTNVNSSIMKQYIEDWYDSNLSSYTSILEPDAGFCNDRTLGIGTSWVSPLTNSGTIIPYGSSGMVALYSGSYIRNWTTRGITSTLSCPRGIVDIYSTSSATGGNKQLSKPIALLTADEAAFAGDGNAGRTSATSYSSNYSYSSYLRSGSAFWLLSPSYRASGGISYGFRLDANGNISSGSVGSTLGVRPVISLKHSIVPISGSGTAADPWIVNPL